MIKERQAIPFTYILTIILMAYSVINAENKIDEAWEAIQKGRISDAKILFLSEVQGKDKIRASLALAYLYEFEFQHDSSWHYYSIALNALRNNEPYITAAFVSQRFYYNRMKKDSGIKELFEKILAGNSPGDIKTMARARLGDIHIEQGEPEKAMEYYNAVGAIETVSVIGPFENLSESGFYEIYPPETGYFPDSVYTGKNGQPARWFDIKSIRRDKWVDFEKYFADNNAVYYGNVFVNSPDRQRVQLRLGTSGSYRLFLNDNLVSECDRERNNDLDTYISEVTLEKGWNRLLIKTGYSYLNRCNFLVRFSDKGGAPLTDLQYSTKPQKYFVKPSNDYTTVPDRFERFFEDYVKQYPNHPEIYILLAEQYYRNQKDYEAEAILKQGLKLFPDNILLLYQLSLVYSRDDRATDAMTLNEKIDKIQKNSLPVLSARLQRARQNGNMEQYEGLLKDFLEVCPQNEEYFLRKFEYHMSKKMPQQASEAIEAGFKLYPDSWNLAYLKTRIAFEKTRDFGKAISFLEEFVKSHATESVFQELAKFYLQASQIEKWELNSKNMTEYFPAVPENYYHMADVYYELHQYQKAEDAIKNALGICPSSSSYYNKLGDILQAQDKKEAAMQAYEKAVSFSSANYDARKKLKELSGPDVMENELPKPDLKKIIAEAPSASDYSGDDAVVLFDNFYRKSYPGGASEIEEEYLAKVLTQKGIKLMTERYIDYNPRAQDLVFDKAVVIKKDGSEIEADQQGGKLVFKSIEVNDCVYIKFKKQNYYSGKLAEHFWDEIYFNKYLPVKSTRYTLVLPSDKELYYTGRNMDPKPLTVKTIGGNKMYVWEMKDLPSVPREYAMPYLNESGKLLSISTIKSWEFLSDWYLNLARAKTNSTQEIKDVVNELMLDKGKSSIEEKIKTIYNYVVENITYSSVPFRQTAFIPQKAEDVLRTRIGDCKDMATLFIAMAKEIGVQANYVLVNTNDLGIQQPPPPLVFFNHAIAEVTIDGKSLLMDLTAEGHPFKTLPNGDLGAFALRIKKGEKEPFYINANDYLSRKRARTGKMLIAEDGSIEFEINSVAYGNVTASMREWFKDQDTVEQKKDLAKSLSSIFTNLEVTGLDKGNYRQLLPELKYQYILKAPNYVTNVGNYKLLKLPWLEDVESIPGFASEKREFGFYYKQGVDTVTEAYDIVLPEGITPIEIPADTKLNCEAASYEIHFKLSKNILHVEHTFINNKYYISPTDYPEFRKFYNAMMERDKTQILLKKS